jgi:hypothetical protein
VANFLFVFLLLFFFHAQVHAQEPATASGAGQTLKGDILYIEGEYLVVKEVSGRESRVHVNGETKLVGVAGKLKAGDKIEATLTPEGHATTVALQGLDQGARPPLP